MHMGAPLHSHTSKVGPAFGNCGSIVEVESKVIYDVMVMVEAVNHGRLPPTSMCVCFVLQFTESYC